MLSCVVLCYLIVVYAMLGYDVLCCAVFVLCSELLYMFSSVQYCFVFLGATNACSVKVSPALFWHLLLLSVQFSAVQCRYVTSLSVQFS